MNLILHLDLFFLKIFIYLSRIFLFHLLNFLLLKLLNLNDLFSHLIEKLIYVL